MINLRIGVAQQFGGNRASILKEACISEEQLSNPTNRITVEDTMEVGDAIVKETGTLDTGLISGSKLRLSSLEILGFSLSSALLITELVLQKEKDLSQNPNRVLPLITSGSMI